MAESDRNTASTVLAAYRSWKEEGESLKARAQGCLMDRFTELIREAQQVQHDLWEDFGHTVKFPANPKPAKKGRGRTAPRKASAPAQVARIPAPFAVSAASGTETSNASPSNVRPSAAGSSTAGASTAPRKPSSSKPGASVTAMKERPAPAPLRVPRKSTVPEVDAESQRRQLQRKLEKAEARLKAARATGDPVRVQNAEDRVYELNDDLRLLAEQLS